MQIRPTAFTIGLIIHSFITLFFVYTEFGIGSQTIKRAGTNKHKGKKFSPPFQRWQGSRGQSHLVALAAVVNYVYLRNPFVCGKNNQTDSGQIRKSIKPPAPKIQSQAK